MAKSEEEPGLITQLQEAIRNSGKSLTRLGKDSHVDPGQLSRFMRGERRLSLEAAEKVCRALGWELTPKRPTPVTEVEEPRRRGKK